VRHDGAGPEDAAVVEHLDRSATELAQRLLDLPDGLRGMGGMPVSYSSARAATVRNAEGEQ